MIRGLLEDGSLLPGLSDTGMTDDLQENAWKEVPLHSKEMLINSVIARTANGVRQDAAIYTY
ncbi:hypothetical protein MASR1M90_00670 [Desulfovibrionales bacterium]